MGKSIDKICITIAVFILTFILSTTITENTILSLVISVALSVLILICSLKINVTGRDRPLNNRQLDTYLIVKGIETQLNILSSIYPTYSIVDKYIVEDRSMIMPIYKFGALSRDDVLKAYRIAISNNIDTIYIISNNIDRNVLTFSTLLYDVKFQFVSSKEIYKILRDNKMLPSLPRRMPASHIPISTILSAMFTRANAPKFLFSATILLLIGLLTPLRTYYFVLSSISALLALSCIFSSNNNALTKKLPPYNKKDLSHK